MKIFYHIPSPSEQLQKYLSAWIWKDFMSGKHRNPSIPEMIKILEYISEDEKKLITLLKEDFDELNIDTFEVERFNFSHAKVKLLCCSLLAKYPKNLVTENELDIKKIGSPKESSGV